MQRNCTQSATFCFLLLNISRSLSAITSDQSERIRIGAARYQNDGFHRVLDSIMLIGA
jgi:hypothetical protein